MRIRNLNRSVRVRTTVRSTVRPAAQVRWLAVWLQDRRRRRAAASPAVPSAPSDLQGSDTGGGFELIWDMTGVEGELGVSIEYRDVDLGEAFHEIATVGPGIGDYASGTAGSNIQCRVRAFNAVGYSPYSNTVTINLV